MVDETYHPHEACFTTGQFSKSSVTEEEASLITHNDHHCGRCRRASQDTGVLCALTEPSECVFHDTTSSPFEITIHASGSFRIQ